MGDYRSAWMERAKPGGKVRFLEDWMAMAATTNDDLPAGLNFPPASPLAQRHHRQRRARDFLRRRCNGDGKADKREPLFTGLPKATNSIASMVLITVL